MKHNLKDRVALVTGAGQGIGAAIAKRLSKAGASIVAVDVQSELAVSIAHEMTKAGGKALACCANVANKLEVEEAVSAAIEEFKRIDILVNNAGIIRDGWLANISETDWDSVLDVNLKGAFFLIQAVFPSMKENHYGKIINISSRAWLGNIGQAN
ncbi:MAG: SDR family NAD(P)-dependent oxidoreductase, partial [Deltaproteobacteria bacterium]|nr:SDR family NAD(P)-dependent oxidoreductase [Deltaproteobacteria bacterium]